VKTFEFIFYFTCELCFPTDDISVKMMYLSEWKGYS